MRTLRRTAAAAIIAVSAIVALPGWTAPAAAHSISCYLPNDFYDLGPWLTCLGEREIHNAEHQVTDAVTLVYCWYLWTVHNEYCF